MLLPSPWPLALLSAEAPACDQCPAGCAGVWRGGVLFSADSVRWEARVSCSEVIAASARRGWSSRGQHPRATRELKIPLGAGRGQPCFLCHRTVSFCPTTGGPSRWPSPQCVWEGGVQGGWQLIERQACGTIVREGRDLLLVWVTQPWGLVTGLH